MIGFMKRVVFNFERLTPILVKKTLFQGNNVSLSTVSFYETLSQGKSIEAQHRRKGNE